MDGRNARKMQNREAILRACRHIMVDDGWFRPEVASIAARSGVSIRTVHVHFPRVDDLYLEAIKDYNTRLRILDRIVGTSQGDIAVYLISKAAVLGRAPS